MRSIVSRNSRLRVTSAPAGIPPAPTGSASTRLPPPRRPAACSPAPSPPTCAAWPRASPSVCWRTGRPRAGSGRGPAARAAPRRRRRPLRRRVGALELHADDRHAGAIVVERRLHRARTPSSTSARRPGATSSAVDRPTSSRIALSATCQEAVGVADVEQVFFRVADPPGTEKLTSTMFWSPDSIRLVLGRCCGGCVRCREFPLARGRHDLHRLDRPEDEMQALAWRPRPSACRRPAPDRARRAAPCRGSSSDPETNSADQDDHDDRHVGAPAARQHVAQPVLTAFKSSSRSGGCGPRCCGPEPHGPRRRPSSRRRRNYCSRASLSFPLRGSRDGGGYIEEA